jgi:hypothetical protein
MLANTCDTGPAGDQPRQRGVVGTSRIPVDHGLACDNLQQSGVVYLSPRCVLDEEGAKSKFGRDIAVLSTPHSPRSRLGERSKTGEPVSIAPRPSRGRHPADRGDWVTHHGTQLRGHGTQRIPEPSPATSRCGSVVPDGRRGSMSLADTRPKPAVTGDRPPGSRKPRVDGCSVSEGSSAPGACRPHGDDRGDGPAARHPRALTCEPPGTRRRRRDRSTSGNRRTATVNARR